MTPALNVGVKQTDGVLRAFVEGFAKSSIPKRWSLSLQSTQGPLLSCCSAVLQAHSPLPQLRSLTLILGNKGVSGWMSLCAAMSLLQGEITFLFTIQPPTKAPTLRHPSLPCSVRHGTQENKLAIMMEMKGRTADRAVSCATGYPTGQAHCAQSIFPHPF